jgi:plastocyanin
MLPMVELQPRPARRSDSPRPVFLTGGALIVVLLGLFVFMRDRGVGQPPVQLPGKVVGRHTASVKNGGVLDMLSERDRFSPTYVNTTAGAHFTVHIQNEGFHAHTFSSAQLGINVVLAPGEAVDVPVVMPGRGTVGFECKIHVRMGMQGAFVVR